MISGRHWNDHEWLGIIPKRPIFRQIEEGASWSYEKALIGSSTVESTGKMFNTFLDHLRQGIFVNGKHENL